MKLSILPGHSSAPVGLFWSSVLLVLFVNLSRNAVEVEGAEMKLPTKFFDPHHHYYDATLDWASYLQSLLGNITYYPEDYRQAVVEPIQAAGVEFLGDVIVEALPVSVLKSCGWPFAFNVL